jgi:ATP-binding cassette, subfamily B, bacterial PglK
MSEVSERTSLRLVFQILGRKDRIRLAVSFLLVFLTTALEMASLTLVIPVVQVVVGGDRRSEYEFLPPWVADLSYLGFVQLLMGALLFVFVLKNLLVLAASYLQQRFQLSITNRVSQRIFESYVRQPYEFHLTNSSSVLVRNVQEYSAAVVTNGVAPVLTLLTDVATGIGLLTVMFVAQPSSTSALLSAFAICGYAIIKIFRARTRRWGEERVRHKGIVLAMLLAGLGGVKEIQVFGRDQQVLATYRSSLHQSAKSSYMFQTLQGIPRAAFEVIAVAGVSGLVVFAVSRGQNPQDTTVAIALFGVVAFRMLPSLNKIIQAVQQLSFGRSALEGALESLNLPQRSVSTSHETVRDVFRILEIVNMKYSYPNTDVAVADIESLTVKAGESIGIVGESGSGKSTLVDLLIGILNPQSGSISVNGRDITNDRRYWQDRIGYVPQHVYLMDTTIRRNVAFGLPEKSINNQDVEKALRLANLWDFVQGLPEGLDTMVGERGVRLSGGQRQRLGIARALYGNPEVIVLDEATSALDTETEREIVESFREIAHDHTLIVVAHRTSTLAHCSRLIRLEKGRIVQEGTFEEVIGSLPDASDRGQ